VWKDLLYLKPTHALILKHTFTSTFIKTACSGKVVNALSTKDNPLRMVTNYDRNMQGFFNDAFTKKCLTSFSVLINVEVNGSA
jgi:hypothetical protein